MSTKPSCKHARLPFIAFCWRSTRRTVNRYKAVIQLAFQNNRWRPKLFGRNVFDASLTLFLALTIVSAKQKSIFSSHWLVIHSFPITMVTSNTAVPVHCVVVHLLASRQRKMDVEGVIFSYIRDEDPNCWGVPFSKTEFHPQFIQKVRQHETLSFYWYILLQCYINWFFRRVVCSPTQMIVMNQLH